MPETATDPVTAATRPPVPLAGLLLAALAFAGTALFGPSLTGLAVAWAQPEYSHGWLIPAVTLFLLLRRRAAILAACGPGSFAGTALVLLGLLVLFLSRISSMLTPAVIGFLLVAGGLGLAALGPRAMRPVWLPLAFLLFALPMPATAYYLLSTKLQLLSSALGAAALRLAGVSVHLEGNIIDLGVYRLQVAEACSGLRYLFPLSAFGFLCAWLFRAPLPARALVLVSVAPITVLVNALRLALTGLLVEHGSIALAEGFLHLFEGWAIFLLALLLLFGEMALLARLRPPRASAEVQGLLDLERIAGTSAIAPPSRPGTRFLPLLLASLLLVAALPAGRWADARPERPPLRPGLATFPLELGPWHGRERPLDATARAVLRPDDYLLADFAAADEAAAVNLWVVYYASQAKGGRIHSPRECLPGSGWEFVRIEPVPAPAGGFVVNRAVIAKGDRKILMYYWYEQRGRRFTDEVWTKLAILVDVLARQRSDGALVRLMTEIRPDEPVAAAEARLGHLFRLAYPRLQPHVGL
ncbi:VPLPA-CTERM-specific exosortase XrtD [Benzoatithermus flavus]|jgi:exosortase D (VPLPA-CTERM-specific)|uniref:VPLPA-CTERM-specific exosortase XrtD n=1 Tax=Benzoatithermus flavus TaxID=3108223 RepID=A0ABU8XXV3_9PROT